MNSFPIYKNGVTVAAVAFANISSAAAVAIPGVGDELMVINNSTEDILITTGKADVQVSETSMLIPKNTQPQIFRIRTADTHVSVSSKNLAANPGITVWRS